MEKNGFSHLHVHSEYSILDGLIRIDELMDWTLANGRGYVALTDHGNLYGAVHFYTSAVKAGLKPILGIEMYVAPGSRHDKNLSKEESNSHLVLFVADSKGYKNLIKLSTYAFTEGFHYRPRIDMELLREYNEGLIATSACLKGRINSEIMHGRYDDACKALDEFLEIFGRDRFFLEFMDHGIPGQKEIRSHLEKLSEDYHVPIIATNDAHYVRSSDAPYQDVMMCVQMGKKVSDTNRLKFSTDQFYLKTRDEMLDVVEGNAQWLENCDLIASQVDFKMELGEFHFPSFKTPDGSSPEKYLFRISHEGLRKRFNGNNPPANYIERIDYELGWINKLGLAPYFLIIDDFIRFVLENKIAKGPGRGSGAGSLVSFALYITDIDPIQFNLLFERFINPARKSMPDMDLDFDPERREEVIEYVRKKYGQDYVCNIITFNRMKARAAVRDVARVLDIPLPQADKVSKLIPMGCRIDEGLEISVEMKSLYENDPAVQNWLDTAKAIEGLCRNVGIHPAGVIIADKPVIEYVPLMVQDKGGGIVCQYQMNDVEQIGLIKTDFLGLRTLTYIEDCVSIIRSIRGEEINLMSIPLDDQKTFQLLWDCDTLGVFQLESHGMRNLMAEIRPDRIGDVIALIALYRPGPIQHASEYASRKHKKEEIHYSHPDMEPILRETYGVLTYQEQITMLLVELAGIELADAVTIIKIISKKRSKEAINEYRKQFIDGTAKKGIPQKQADTIFDSIVTFAGYGFNKSHSAAYGLVAYWTAYLKANYPLEFYCAFLTSEMHDSDKIAEILSELRSKNIRILPPDINKSLRGFKVEDGAIRFGLAAIKGVGTQAVKAIVASRKKSGDFRDFLDLTKRVDLFAVNRGAIENLIKSGAMDCLPKNRQEKISAMDRALEIGKKIQEDLAKGQEQLFGMMQDSMSESMDIFQKLDDFPKQQKLRMEKQLTGFYLTGHPLDPFLEQMKGRVTPIANIHSMQNGEQVVVGCLITQLSVRISKNLEEYAILRVEDFSGSIEAMVFPRAMKNVKKELIQESVIMAMGNIRVEIRETQTEDGETVEIRQVSLSLEKVRNYQTPSDIKESSEFVIEKTYAKHISSPEPMIDFEDASNGPLFDIDKVDLLFGYPMDSSIMKQNAELLKNALELYEGSTKLDIVFETEQGRMRVDLGMKSGCDYEKVREELREKLIGVKWSR
jgi:DNA polymerase-3 subunit alpha